MSNIKYIKFFLKALFALTIVLLIPQIFSSFTSSGGGSLPELFSKNSEVKVESESIEFSDIESRQGGVISDSIVGSKLKNYLINTLENSGVAQNGQADEFVNGLFKNLDGLFDNANGNELDDVLKLDSVRDLLNALGINSNEVDTNSILDALNDRKEVTEDEYRTDI